jgi:hypothetical protein
VLLRPAIRFTLGTLRVGYRGGYFEEAVESGGRVFILFAMLSTTLQKTHGERFRRAAEVGSFCGIPAESR